LGIESVPDLTRAHSCYRKALAAQSRAAQAKDVIQLLAELGLDLEDFVRGTAASTEAKGKAPEQALVPMRTDPKAQAKASTPWRTRTLRVPIEKRTIETRVTVFSRTTKPLLGQGVATWIDSAPLQDVARWLLSELDQERLDAIIQELGGWKRADAPQEAEAIPGAIATRG
jgi:hypothetical protein